MLFYNSSIAPATALATSERKRAALPLDEGWTRLVSRTMPRSSCGSMTMLVPVKPVWPYADGDSRSPAVVVYPA